LSPTWKTCWRSQRPHNPQRPPRRNLEALIIETRAPIRAKPGRKARHDYEYERMKTVLFHIAGKLDFKATNPHAA
jgi:hypothetical protein